MQQAVHKVPNLSDELRTEQGEADFVKRVAVVDKVRSSLNTIAIDALEDYTVQSSSVTGVSDLIDRFAEALSSVSDIPMFILMGKSMGGLSNGDTNKEAWLAKVVGEQNVKLRKPTDRLITLINLADSKGSSDGGDYTIEFNPLFTLSEEKQAEVDNKCADTKKKTMETFKGYVDMQVMEQDEVREDIREEYDLEGDAPEPKEDPGSGTTVLNPGQAIVPNQPGQINPAIKAT
jgi:phage-related protein (TIGR01555 family)